MPKTAILGQNSLKDLVGSETVRAIEFENFPKYLACGMGLATLCEILKNPFMDSRPQQNRLTANQ